MARRSEESDVHLNESSSADSSTAPPSPIPGPSGAQSETSVANNRNTELFVIIEVLSRLRPKLKGILSSGNLGIIGFLGIKGKVFRILMGQGGGKK